MSYFHTKNKKNDRIKLPLCIAVFMIVMIYLTNLVSALSMQTAAKEQETLEQALSRSTVQFYALEGYYPENISQLTERFNISYDDSKFFLDYQAQGANIYPEITVIRRSN